MVDRPLTAGGRHRERDRHSPVTWLYEYATVTVEPDGVPVAMRQFRASAEDRVRAAGGRLIAAWRGQIGIPIDVFVVMTGWPHDSAITSGGAAIRDVEGIARWDAELLVPTARPAEPETLRAPGVYAHRWFVVAKTDLAEFVDLSAGAWPAFEAAYDARIAGLWRSVQSGPAIERLLLVTRYPSLAAWEKSRGVLREGDQAARESGERFLRRRELTRWTTVATTELLAVSGGDAAG